MKGLIDSLLTYSRVVNVEAIPFAPVPLDAAVHWASMNLQAVIEETRASVTHDELPTVTADHVQLVQLFQNLISNAIKYRKPEEPPQIHISAEERAHCVVSVRDNGIGIQPGDTRNAFWRVQAMLHGQRSPGMDWAGDTQADPWKSTGEIWVNSEPGQGATFCFTIPCQDRAFKTSR